MTRPSGSDEVEAYMRQFPVQVRELLQQVRVTIQEAAPEAEEAISYGIPTFKLHGNLVHFAGYKAHIGFYPTPSGVEKFKDQLVQYKHAKGSIRLPLDQPLPLDLIREIVLFRVSENRAKKLPKKH